MAVTAVTVEFRLAKRSEKEMIHIQEKLLVSEQFDIIFLRLIPTIIACVMQCVTYRIALIIHPSLRVVGYEFIN